jgi:N-acetyl-gamma-glutamyl-phosphate reductase
MPRVGIVGASGFTGAELLRLCVGHDELDVVVATGDTQAGRPVAELYPGLAAAYPDLAFEPYTADVVDGLDAVFLGLPHGASQAVAADLIDRVGAVLDLSADFRLHDARLYPQWYGAEHTAPQLLDTFVYGLPELFRDDLVGAGAVAVPGCYPTAASLALAPLARAGLIELTGIVVDAASGVSGAGRAPKEATTFCTVSDDFAAYGLLDHRHTPEMEQVLATVAGNRSSVLFTPHLAPMSRGILATCYARPTAHATAVGTESLMATYRDAYGDEPFVVVTDEPPTTKATLGANTARVTVRHDERTGWIVALCAIDNLVKGASGQAVQCANLALGLAETSGLPTVAVTP